MKQLVFVICLSFVMISCHHDLRYVQYEIINHSNYEVVIQVYRSGFSNSTAIIRLPNKGNIWRSEIGIKSDGADYFPTEAVGRIPPSLGIRDSAHIVFDNQKVIIHNVYTRQRKEKNIFRPDSYELERLKKKKHLSITYRYYITEEDYENAKEINDNK